jgi:hypothetical protein
MLAWRDANALGLVRRKPTFNGRQPWQINVIEDHNGWIASYYAISSIPHLFIIGRNGRVLANHIGYGDRSIDDLVSDINHALSEATSVEPGGSPPATGST